MAPRRPSATQLDLLVGIGEAARRLGIQRDTLLTIRKRDKAPGRQRPLPDPAKADPILYWMPDLETWARETGRELPTN